MNTIKAEKITSFINARPIKEFGLARLKGKIEVLGYLANFPLTVASCIEGKDGFTLVDGRHRFTVGTDLGIDEFPCQQVEGDRDFLLSYALKSNEASETVVPTFFTDQAELIWRLAEEGKTQEQISKILGWSRGNVSNYIALSNVHREAWFSIATSIEKDVASQNGNGVAGVATSVAFTEGLLRSILHLTPAPATRGHNQTGRTDMPWENVLPSRSKHVRSGREPSKELGYSISKTKHQNRPSVCFYIGADILEEARFQIGDFVAVCKDGEFGLIRRENGSGNLRKISKTSNLTGKVVATLRPPFVMVPHKIALEHECTNEGIKFLWPQEGQKQ